jgi:2-phosphoglycerate kinase
MNEELWYEIASESQAHLFTRPITKIVKDDLTDKEVFAKAEEKGLDMKTVRFNLLTLFKTIAETFIEECYLPK